MIRPCPEKIDCEGSDNPISNYSAEAPDGIDYLKRTFVPYNPPLVPPPGTPGTPPGTPGTPPETWSSTVCGATYVSQISQFDADLHAQAFALDCASGDGNNPNLVYNTAQTCCVTCPDGTQSCYTVPAGLFPGNNQAEADALAHNYACRIAVTSIFCITPIKVCLCVGVATIEYLTYGNQTQSVTWHIGGTIPPGLAVNGNVIAGTPTTAGQYLMTVTTTDPTTGIVMLKTIQFTVLDLDVSAIPTYQVGVPYSYQLTPTGDPHSTLPDNWLYSFAIKSGALPDGLTMDSKGLISGTPTGLNAGTMPIEIEFVDTVCEALEQEGATPAVAVVTRSQTRIAEVKGFPEFIPSSPPKKYKNLAWNGTATQTVYTSPSVFTPPALQLSFFQYLYSGTATINSAGTLTSSYTKNLFSACSPVGFTPFAVDELHSVYPTWLVKGFCYPPESRSCPVCNFSPGNLIGDYSTNSITDTPNDIWGSNLAAKTSTSLSAHYTAGPSWPLALEGGSTPITTLESYRYEINNRDLVWVAVRGIHDWDAVLSDEYTDAEALANAIVINSTGATAQNAPRTTGFVSSYTSVDYDLNCSDLIKDKNYIVTVTFRSKNWVQTTKTYAFTASDVTHKITDSIATPVAGETTTLLSATIAAATVP